ncbi:phosphate transport system permease protein [Nocardioides psychrotolerans]|uniref:Phosphate transport system permease protein n=1 Tax=Nocardioides psychrotolerans TaxID=1005945 RepID=A0A1I3H3W2_9ACTN|nr:phosphate ABC transporter permease subunit PstC [Nocardioides psychrotolerans]GEP37759.1 phosphate transport system permease protein [Nocardioides psychrotolerans]SFI30369.1 phosphate transport system permease protein [Nocardioides psychrotolerans]
MANVRPRKISRKATGGDAVFENGARAVGASVLLITGGVGVFLAWQAYPTLERYGWSFFTESQWQPDQDVIGIAAVLVGTFSVAMVAMAFAVPLSILMALYISEYAPARFRSSLVALIDLMAAVPSIVYGLWGFFLIMPYAAELALWLQRYLGWIPIFDVANTDPNAAVWDTTRYVASAFCAGIAVAMMVMPMACAVMRQVFSQTPDGEKEAALALGATRWGMVTSVVLPFGRGGIIGGTMLGLGRALGETIAVVLIVSPAFEIKPRILEVGTTTVSSLIAGRFGEASSSQLSALLAAGFVLFVITLLVNTVASVVVNRSRSGAGTDA